MRAKEFIIESKVNELSPALMQRAADKLQDRINRSSNLDDEDKLIARQVRMSHKARKNEKGDLYKKKKEDIEEAKKNRRDVKHSVKPKAPNPVAKHAMSTIGGGGFGAHKDKKKAEKQGDVKHKARQYEEGVEEATKKPNATTRHLRDYPVSDKDVAKPVKKPEKKKSEQGVAEGSGKNVVKSVKVGNFRHDLVDTGMGWQVRIYNGDELYDTGMSKNSEQKGLAALEDAVAYTEKQTRTKRQGVAEGEGKTQKYEMMMRNGQVKKFVAKDDADAKRIAAGHGAKSVIRLKGGVPAGKVTEQGVAEGSLETDNMVSHIGQVIQSIYPRGGDKNTYMKLVAREMPRIVKANPKLFRRAFGMAYDRFFHIDQDDDFDYTDYSMRQGERGVA